MDLPRGPRMSRARRAASRAFAFLGSPSTSMAAPARHRRRTVPVIKTKCTDCGIEFLNTREYYRHRATVHSGATQQRATPRRKELGGGQTNEELPNRQNNPAAQGLEIEFRESQYAPRNIQNPNRNIKVIKAIEVLQEFTENTTLHGIKYFTKRVSTMERIFWIVTFMVSIMSCAFLMYSVWFKWRYTPVIVSINDKLVSVGEVPFPSVTICKSLNCDGTGFGYSEYWNDTDKLTMDLPTLCKWRGQNTSCEEIFKTVFTREGKCYIFNGLAHFEILNSNMKKEHIYIAPEQPSVNWTPHGYNSSEDPVYPRRGQGCSLKPDLDIEFHRDNGCKDKNVTFKIYVRHPTVLPQTSKDYYMAVLGELTTLALSYKVLNTSENLQEYSAEVLQCYFPGERKLRYFEIYSPENCELECITNITLINCNCVLMYMPHGFTTPLCGSKSINCTIEAQERFAVESSRGMNAGHCKCFPSCLRIDYQAEVTKSYLDSQIPHQPNGDRSSYAKIQMYFKESRVMSMRRWDLGLREYGLVDFLANCGGLLGLFLGFSSLSLVEIFYYLTLRIWCALKHDTASE